MAEVFPATLAITGATIIDGNGGTPIQDGVIAIEGSRISAVGDHSTQLSQHARRIPAEGKFVIPGLMSTHAYLVDGAFATTLIRYDGRYDEVAIEAAQLALKNGLTTVFDYWGPRDPLIQARNTINQGRAIGSRILLAGNVVGWGGPFSEDFRPLHKAAVPQSFVTRVDALWEQNVGHELAWLPPEELRQEIRKYAHSGIDFVHYAVTAHQVSAWPFLVFSPRAQQVIVEEAHCAGLPALGFMPATEEALLLEMTAGVDLLALGGLCQPVSGETAALIAQRQIPCGLSLLTDDDLEWFRQQDKPLPHLSKIIDRDREDRNYRALLRADAMVFQSGAGSFLGAETLSDFAGHHPPHGELTRFGETHFSWLRAARDKGMRPMTALMAATRNVAKAFKVDKDLGTLEPGKLADALILDKNPLKDAENYRSISVVIKEGKVIDRDALPSKRLLTAPAPELRSQ